MLELHSVDAPSVLLDKTVKPEAAFLHNYIHNGLKFAAVPLIVTLGVQTEALACPCGLPRSVGTVVEQNCIARVCSKFKHLTEPQQADLRKVTEQLNVLQEGILAIQLEGELCLPEGAEVRLREREQLDIRLTVAPHVGLITDEVVQLACSDDVALGQQPCKLRPLEVALMILQGHCS